MPLGEALGEVLGEALGEAVGKVLSEAVGEALGKALGAALGEAMGEVVGEALGDAVADAGQGRIILGDLNAELPDALGREGRQPKLADELLHRVAEGEPVASGAPDALGPAE